MHRDKVDPGVSELPRGNELSRDHVNRPLVLPSSSDRGYAAHKPGLHKSVGGELGRAGPYTGHLEQLGWKTVRELI